MVTKSELLKKLSPAQLKEIAVAEGIKLPKASRKPKVIRQLLTLSMSKIREYVAEYEEEEIERVTVTREKIKRRKARVGIREKERMKVSLSREKLLTDLVDRKIRLGSSIIKKFGHEFRFHPKTKGSLYSIYREFSDEALRVAHECFVRRTLDKRGRFLEYRFAQWLTKKDKAIDKVEIDKKIVGIGEIDVVGYSKKGDIISIAECKARKGKASKEQIDPWLKNVELIFNKTKQTLKRAYFVNVAGFTDGIKRRIVEGGGINRKGFLVLEKSRVKLTEGALWFGYKAGVNIFLCEERTGKIKQIFP